MLKVFVSSFSHNAGSSKIPCIIGIVTLDDRFSARLLKALIAQDTFAAGGQGKVREDGRYTWHSRGRRRRFDTRSSFFFFFFFSSQTTREGSARYYKNLCVKCNNYRKIETGRDIIALAIKFASP